MGHKACVLVRRARVGDEPEGAYSQVAFLQRSRGEEGRCVGSRRETRGGKLGQGSRRTSIPRAGSPDTQCSHCGSVFGFSLILAQLTMLLYVVGVISSIFQLRPQVLSKATLLAQGLIASDRKNWACLAPNLVIHVLHGEQGCTA